MVAISVLILASHLAVSVAIHLSHAIIVVHFVHRTHVNLRLRYRHLLLLQVDLLMVANNSMVQVRDLIDVWGVFNKLI